MSARSLPPHLRQQERQQARFQGTQKQKRLLKPSQLTSSHNRGNPPLKLKPGEIPDKILFSLSQQGENKRNVKPVLKDTDYISFLSKYKTLSKNDVKDAFKQISEASEREQMERLISPPKNNKKSSNNISLSRLDPGNDYSKSSSNFAPSNKVKSRR